jgi:hypothetical protein
MAGTLSKQQIMTRYARRLRIAAIMLARPVPSRRKLEGSGVAGGLDWSVSEPVVNWSAE